MLVQELFKRTWWALISPVTPFRDEAASRGWKLRFWGLYGQGFPRCGLIFKIIIFGHETQSVTKDSEVAHTPSVSFVFD